MTNWKTAAAHGINKYVWKVIQEELSWTKIGALTPIIPVQEQPEMTNAKQPYIVYRYSTQPYGTDWYTCIEQCTYVVYSSSETEIREAVNLLTAMFKRFDESAQQINDWIDSNGNADNKAYDYKYVRVNMSSAPEEVETTEGGRAGGIVVIQYMYSHDSDNSPLEFAE